MVKKKGKSKRTTLKDKYKIQRRITETHRKQKKQAKRDAANGIVKHDKKKKDPGIPNSWPFKQDLLKEIQRTREKQKQNQEEAKNRRKTELQSLREHQAQGGQAKTVQEMLEQAKQDQAEYQSKSEEAADEQDGFDTKKRSDGTVEAGQPSRRAYLRELKKVVDTADILLQVLDARDPISSRIHPTMESTILSRVDKRMVLVLNKIDLVPKDVVGAWLTALRRSHPTIAIKAGIDHRSSSTPTAGSVNNDAAVESSPTVPVGMEGLLQLLKNYARTGSGKGKTTIVVGVIGYPNVGKSSIINALKRTRAVGVSPRPGFTTTMQEVVLDRNVRLLDSPGVIFDDKSALLGNCIDAESMADPIPPVAALLQRCNHASLLMTYNIPTFPPGDVMMFLAMIARSYGRVLKGGIPDKVAAARQILKDWNSGKIPYYTVPPEGAAPEKSNDATVVSSFSKEFDLSQFDDAVIKSLKDRDEMDFVQLDDVKVDNTADTRKWKEGVDYLMRDVDGNDDDESVKTIEDEDMNDA